MGITPVERESYSKMMEAANNSSLTLNINSTKSGENLEKMSKIEWSQVLFQIFQFKMTDIEGIVISDDGESCEVQLNKNVDSTLYTTKQIETAVGRSFKINGTNKQSNSVLFKGVPLTCPDLELTHLIKCHGGIIKEGDKIKHETINFVDPSSGQEVSFRTSTRSIDAVFPSNRRPKTFYWLAGPAREDKLQRIIVQHSSQLGRQCGNCLRVSTDPVDPCKFNGRTAQCRKSGERCSLAAYFRQLKVEEGYTSVRNLFNYEDLEVRRSEESFSSDFLNKEDEQECDSAARVPRGPSRPSSQSSKAQGDAQEENEEGAPTTPVGTPEGPKSQNQAGPKIAVEAPKGPNSQSTLSGPPTTALGALGALGALQSLKTPRGDKQCDTNWAIETETLQEVEQRKHLLIKNNMTYIKSKLEKNGPLLSSEDLEYLTSELINIDTSRYHLVEGRAVAKEGKDPLYELKMMLEDVMKQTGIKNCDTLLNHFAEKMSNKATEALLGREGVSSKVQRSRSKSRPRSCDDESDLGAKSQKLAKLDVELTTTKRQEVFTKVAHLLGQDNPNAQDLDYLGSELAELPSLLDLHQGRYHLNQHGQLIVISRREPSWPWRDLKMMMEADHPDHDPKQLDKFMSFTHGKIRNFLFNNLKTDQALKKQIEEQEYLLASLEDIPYSDFDEVVASQRMVEATAEEGDKEIGKKDNQVKAGEEEKEEEKKEEEKKEEASSKEKKDDKRSKESYNKNGEGEKDKEKEVDFPPLGSSPKRNKTKSSPLSSTRLGKGRQKR